MNSEVGPLHPRSGVWLLALGFLAAVGARAAESEEPRRTRLATSRDRRHAAVVSDPSGGAVSGRAGWPDRVGSHRPENPRRGRRPWRSKTRSNTSMRSFAAGS